MLSVLHKLRAFDPRTVSDMRTPWDLVRTCEPKCIGPFWAKREATIAQAVLPYIYFPISNAVIERFFSLAGLIDVKNRQQMSSNLRQAAVGMF